MHCEVLQSPVCPEEKADFFPGPNVGQEREGDHPEQHAGQGQDQEGCQAGQEDYGPRGRHKGQGARPLL